MGQRRKHVTQHTFSQSIEAPAANQHIVRALGSRGGNIVEVEYPSGDTTLCMMPAKFNRKLWVKRGGYLIVESSPEAEQDASSRVTGTIAAVLYDEHIKQLKKMQGVWPVEFASPQAPSRSTAAGATASQQEEGDPLGSSSDSERADEDENDDEGEEADAGEAAASSRGAGAGSSRAAGPGSSPGAAAEGAAQACCSSPGAEADQADSEEEEEDDDDGLPPLQQINNRRVVHHYVSDSDSDSEEG